MGKKYRAIRPSFGPKPSNWSWRRGSHCRRLRSGFQCLRGRWLNFHCQHPLSALQGKFEAFAVGMLREIAARIGLSGTSL